MATMETMSMGRDLPVAPRFMLIGAVLAGAVGCIVGLVIGLQVHAATAWFATFEVGIPCALTGGLAGGIVGLFTTAIGRLRTH